MYGYENRKPTLGAVLPPVYLIFRWKQGLLSLTQHVFVTCTFLQPLIIMLRLAAMYAQ